MRYAIAVFRFAYDFLVGDDWLVAVGIVSAIALTALIADRGVAAWWVMPLAVIALLVGSLRRALRAAGNSPGGS